MNNRKITFDAALLFLVIQIATCLVTSILYLVGSWLGTYSFHPIGLALVISSSLIFSALFMSFLQARYSTITNLAKKYNRMIKQHYAAIKQEKMEELKVIQNRLNELKEETKHLYFVQNVEISNVHPLAFIVTIQPNFIHGILPEILVNGSVVTKQKLSDNQIMIFCRGILKATDAEIVLTIGTETYTYANPFCISFQNAVSAWQCEGHAKERVIFIELKQDSKISGAFVIPIQLLVNNRIHFEGEGTLTRNILTIPIPTVHKRDCINRDCIVRLKYKVSEKLLLPKPEVFIVNGESVVKN